MKIATFNANSIRARMSILVDWLETQQPDVVGVQETKVQDSDFPTEPIEAAGYQVVFKGQKSYNGVALISKKPAMDISFGFDTTEPADESRFLRATIGGITFVNTYVPQGREIDHEMYPYKLEWFNRLRDYFDRHFTPKDKVVWLGDINVARHPIDVYKPEKKKKHVCYHDDVRAAFEHCMDWGFVDVWREQNPEAVEFSFYDFRTPAAIDTGRGWRIDYVLASPPVAKKVSASYIDLEPRMKEKPSDHTFLVAELS